MKLCKDCRYYIPESICSNALCTYVLSPVSGKPYETCYGERLPFGRCKPEAVNFVERKAKAHWLRRLLGIYK